MSNALPTITRTFTGSRHTGYLVENEFGAVAIVTEGKRGGYFVRTEAALYHTACLLDARDIAIRTVAI